ncbi:class I SAM-dependent methyltransferase [Methanospirillum hungatei]|uniref:class I SAM-dependent methyltransferase n=1 Tax=Methanospirillum hungatei TaxID=2203 RepID=UPI0026F2DE91|nr:class I SAM-dependent methyltransferase [Methanospirillum hungatei]MCA1916281.1 class I SAM-dependent methyltransferase [Methanospirillum hungatei]
MEISRENQDPVKKNVRIYWNERSKTFDQDVGHGADHHECQLWKNQLRTIIGDDKKDVLDVGTGTGMIAINLAELGHSVTGIDLCEEMLDIANRKAESKDLSIRFLLGDAENPEFPDRMFDVVICRHLLWTLPHPDVAIREWSRICRPGGVIIAIDGHQEPKDYFHHSDEKDESEKSDQEKLWEQTYSKEITMQLPNGDQLTIESLKELFTANGLGDVQSKNLKDIAEYHQRLHSASDHERQHEVNIIWGTVQ